MNQNNPKYGTLTFRHEAAKLLRLYEEQRQKRKELKNYELPKTIKEL